MARITAFLVVALGATATCLNAQKPVDACALLKLADAQAFAGNATVKNGVPATEPTGATICEYRWGTGSANSGATFLKLTVVPTAKVYPNVSPAVIKESFAMMAKGKDNTELLSGIGEAAIYESGQEIQVMATALARGSVLQLKLDTTGARGKKDQVIALLKTIVGRL